MSTRCCQKKKCSKCSSDPLKCCRPLAGELSPLSVTGQSPLPDTSPSFTLTSTPIAHGTWHSLGRFVGGSFTLLLSLTFPTSATVPQLGTFIVYVQNAEITAWGQTSSGGAAWTSPEMAWGVVTGKPLTLPPLLGSPQQTSAVGVVTSAYLSNGPALALEISFETPLTNANAGPQTWRFDVVFDAFDNSGTASLVFGCK